MAALDGAPGGVPASAAVPAARAEVPFDDLGAVRAAAHRGEGDALRDLARAWQVALDVGDACQAAQREGLACHRSRGGLAAARQLSRPAVLALRADGGGSAVHVVLLGLDERAALLAAGERRWRIALPALAGAWRGEFVTLWRPPPGWRPASQGAPEEVAAWVSQRLADAGQGDTTLSLPERIWSFQVASGLEPDGVAGPLTLMQLAQSGDATEPRLQGATAPR